MKSLRFRSYPLVGVEWAILRMVKYTAVSGRWNKNNSPKPKGVMYR